MFQLVYLSRETEPFTPEALRSLLAHARRNNAALGITGMLLYRDGHFLQALEGDETTVRSLCAKISRDSRHSQVTYLFEENIEEREFADWSMGFHDEIGRAHV